MTLPTRIFATVTERDVDLLLLEEFRSSARFRSWWLREAGLPEVEQHHFIGAWHSHSTQFGESDVLLVVEDGGGRRYAVMVEDKIYAAPQPRQGERYVERGEEGRAAGLWADYRTCITAAEAYLKRTSQLDQYSAHISHEAVRDWFARSRTRRAQHKVELLNAAIGQSKRGYVLAEVPVVTDFWLAYWTLANDEFPELRMKRPARKGYKSRWVPFARPSPRRRLIHKLDDGYVDLECRGAFDRLASLGLANRDVLDGTIRLEQAGGSAVFRITVPRIDHHGIAAEQLDRIREGLEAARRLLVLSPAIKGDSDVE